MWIETEIQQHTSVCEKNKYIGLHFKAMSQHRLRS